MNRIRINTLQPCSLGRCLKRFGCITGGDFFSHQFSSHQLVHFCAASSFLTVPFMPHPSVLEPSISHYTPLPGYCVHDHGASLHGCIFLQKSYQLELSACSKHSELNLTSSSSLFPSVNGAITSQLEVRPWSFPDGFFHLSIFLSIFSQ